MNRIALVAIMFLLLILRGVSFSNESPLISESQLLSLSPDGGISINRILDNGDLLCIIEPGKGKNVRVSIVNPVAKKIIKSLEIPEKSISYIASNPDGTMVMLFSQFSSAFFLADLREGKCRVIFKKEKGKPGYSLYGENRSRLNFVDGHVIAWAYYYSENSKFGGDYVVEIDPAKDGIEAFTRIIKTDELRNISKQYLPGAETLQNIQVNGDFIVFNAMIRNKGCIIAYDMKNRKHFKIDDFKNFSGSAIARQNPLLAYCVTRKESGREIGELSLFDLQAKKKTVMTTGKLFNPVFNPSGDTLAVGSAGAGGDKEIAMGMKIIRLGDKSEKSLSFGPKKIFVDWKFADNSKYILTFTGRDIYRYEVK